MLAYSEATGRLSYRAVKQTFVRKADKLYVITYGDGTVIKTTWSHPFFIEGRGWVKARDLAGGDMSYTAGYVRTLNQAKMQAGVSGDDFSGNYGSTVAIDFNDPNSGTAGSAAGIVSVRVVPQATAATVYNFQVAKDHTYFVTKRRVLVHNDAIYVDFPKSAEGHGHAGIVVVDKNGKTKYHQFGPYGKKGKGKVESWSKLPKLKMGPDGKPTKASMRRLMTKISKNRGGQKIEGAYISTDPDAAKKMNDFAKKMKTNYSKSRTNAYNSLLNNCGSFAKKTLSKGGVTTFYLTTRPNTDISILQSIPGYKTIQYTPKRKKNKSAFTYDAR